MDVGPEHFRVHPKGKAPSPLSGEGVLIELVQAPKEVIEFYDKL